MLVTFFLGRRADAKGVLPSEKLLNFGHFFLCRFPLLYLFCALKKTSLAWWCRIVPITVAFFRGRKSDTKGRKWKYKLGKYENRWRLHETSKCLPPRRIYMSLASVSFFASLTWGYLKKLHWHRWNENAPSLARRKNVLCSCTCIAFFWRQKNTKNQKKRGPSLTMMVNGHRYATWGGVTQRDVTWRGVK